MSESRPSLALLVILRIRIIFVAGYDLRGDWSRMRAELGRHQLCDLLFAQEATHRFPPSA